MERSTERNQREEIYYPSFLFKEMVVMMFVFILVVFILSRFFPAEMGDPADPTDNLYVPKPAWYFMWLYQLLKYFPGRLEIIATTIIPTGAFAALLILPFVEKGPQRKPTERPLSIALMGAAVLGVALLTVLGLRS
jgi:ubiquinol-cytochrome c reductase cytochrome b subunit